jgi:hypothetical protein
MAGERYEYDTLSQIESDRIDADAASPAHEDPAKDEQSIEEITDNTDGSSTVRFSGEVEDPADRDFFENLAEILDESELHTIGTTLVETIKRDVESRHDREELFEKGLQRSGMGADKEGGADFEGSATQTHPVIAESCIDFEARAIKQLFPAEGPAKANETTKDAVKIEIAKAKAKFLNWQCTKQIPELRPELERALMQAPMFGDSYLKMYPDRRMKRPTVEYVSADDMILAAGASSYETSLRKTHRILLSRVEYDRRVRSGEYRDVDNVEVSGLTPDLSKVGEAQEKVSGVTLDPYNTDGFRIVYECQTFLELDDGDPYRGLAKDAANDNADHDEPTGDASDDDDDDYDADDQASDVEVAGESDEHAGNSSLNVRRDGQGVAPYVVTVDEITGNVLAFRRNWDPDDDTEEELQWFVDFPFVPWEGALSIGFPHMIGNLAGGATGALRALLDSAHVNNFPGVLKLKGVTGGQSARIDPTAVIELDGGPNVTDIRMLAMAIPFNPPSTMLLQLLQFLVDSAKGVVRTVLDESQDNQNVPVGTMMARIEEGMVVFSAIHARMHYAMGQLLDILCRINASYMDEIRTNKKFGEFPVTREMFKGTSDTVPVSDPNIFSEMQLAAQINMIAQRAALDQMGTLYDKRKVETFILKQTRIPNAAEELLVAHSDPSKMNPANENVAAALGRPISAFPDQDDKSHIAVHIAFLQDQLFGSLPSVMSKALPLLLQHIVEHLLFWYAKSFHQVGSAAANTDISAYMKDDDNAVAFDQLMAAANPHVLIGLQKEFGGLQQVLADLAQKAQQLAPPPPMDPGKSAMQVAQINTQSAQQVATLTTQQRDKQAQIEAGVKQLDIQTRAQTAQAQQAAEAQRTQSQDATKVQTTNMDNQTAEAITVYDAQQGKKSDVTTGTAVGKREPTGT